VGSFILSSFFVSLPTALSAILINVSTLWLIIRPAQFGHYSLRAPPVRHCTIITTPLKGTERLYTFEKKKHGKNKKIPLYIIEGKILKGKLKRVKIRPIYLL
jgi:hypothetical protein